MDSVGLGVRLLLALVFIVAAASKLTDQDGTRSALEDFRVPRRLLAALAVALPLAELATATALLVRPAGRFGGVAALVLLGMFGAAIGAAMARGEAPDCHCFGQLHSAPAGRVTLVRNGLLVVLAAFVAWYGPGSSLAALLPGGSARATAASAAAALAAALGAIALELHLHNRRLSRDLSRAHETMAVFPVGLPVGARAPVFSLRSLEGAKVTLDGLLAARRPLALVFVSPGCAPCVFMFETLARWQRQLTDRITIALVGTAPAERLASLAELGLRNVLVDSDAELFKSYNAAATPSAVIVTPDGRIGSATRSTAPIVEALIRRALADAEAAPAQRTLTVRQQFGAPAVR